jgi:hypothetical protein
MNGTLRLSKISSTTVVDRVLSWFPTPSGGWNHGLPTSAHHVVGGTRSRDGAGRARVAHGSRTPARAYLARREVRWHARAAVPLRVPERHRILRRVEGTVRQTVGHRLEWAAWRRWPQGGTQYSHDKRRAVP